MMATENRETETHEGFVLTSEGDRPDWAREIPDWLLDMVACMQPSIADGIHVAISQDSEAPGVWKLVGRAPGDPDDRCLACASTLGAIVEIRRCRFSADGVGPDSEITLVAVCNSCIPTRASSETRS